ncbi:hypothetical protein V8F33_013776 [Rhypophila sp. PSN 637]
MAELLGVAASAVSLVAFAGQLLKSAIVLHSFFKNIQDAPSHVQRLSDELDAIIPILTKVKSSSRDDDPDLERVLGLIQSTIENISKTVISLLLSPAESKTRRTWNNVKAVFKNAGISTLFNELETCKSMLLQVTQARHSEALGGLQRSMTGFSLDQSNQTVSIRKTVCDTQTAIESIQSVVTTTQNVIGTTSVTVQHLANETVLIRETVQRIEYYLIQRQPMLFAAFGHDIKNAILQELQQVSREIQASNAARTGGASVEMINARNSERALVSDGRGFPLACRDSCFLNAPPSKWKREFSTVSTSSSVRSMIFGQLRMKTLTVFYSKSDPETRVHEQNKEETSSPAPAFGLRTMNVIPIESEIIQAVKRADIRTVRNLFQAGRATPFDIDTRGRNLLQYATFSCLLDDNFHPVHGFGENWKQLGDLRRLIDLFLGFDMDPGEMTPGCKTTPLTSFIASWSAIAGYRGVSDGFNDELASIFFKLATNVKTDCSYTAPMILLVCTDGDYSVVNLPSLHGVHLSFRTIEFLMRQKDWPILWNPWQPLAAALLEVGMLPGDLHSFLCLLLARSNLRRGTLLKADQERPQPCDPDAAGNSDQHRGIWPSHGPGKVLALERYVYQSTAFVLDYLPVDEWDKTSDILNEMGLRIVDYVRNDEILRAFRLCPHSTVQEIGSYYVEHDSNINIAESEEEATRTSALDSDSETSEPSGCYNVEHTANAEEATRTSTLDSRSETAEPSDYHDIEHDSDADTGPNEEEKNRSTVDSDSDSETVEPPGMTWRRRRYASITLNGREGKRGFFLRPATCPDYSQNLCPIREGSGKIDYEYWFRKYDEIR